MGAFLRRAAVVALCVVPLQAHTYLGHQIPDSLETIDGDHTVSGVEIVGGIGGTGMLTMTDADTLIIAGDADFSGITLSDSTAGLIVFALVPDTTQETTRTIEFGNAVLNDLWFVGAGEDLMDVPILRFSGDSLTLKGDFIATDSINRVYIGTQESPMSMNVRGDMRMKALLGRINAYGGTIVVHGDYDVPRIWWSYHGLRSTVLEFAGSDTQTVQLGSIDHAAKEQEYGKIVHSGEGVVRLIGRGVVCDTFVQTAGTLDLNGFSLTADVIRMAGVLDNEVSWSYINQYVLPLDETTDTIIYDTIYNPNAAVVRVLGSAEFSGTVEGVDTTYVTMNPAYPWQIDARGSVVAHYARIGSSTVIPDYARGLAYNSIDEGGNTGWVFREGGSALSRKLADSMVVLSDEPVELQVAAVIVPGDENVSIEWTVDGAAAGTGELLEYSQAAMVADSGKLFRAYLKQGATVLDSAGPMILIVEDRPRLDDDIDGKEGLVGDTLRLSVERIAGVDSLQWYRIDETGGTDAYVAIEGAIGDTLVLDSVTKDMHGITYAVIAFDTNTTAYPSDTSSDDIEVVWPVTITEQPQSVTAFVGDDVFFTVTAQSEWEGTLEYRWRVNGDDVDAAANFTAETDTLVLTSITADMIGNEYEVVISGDGGKRYYSNQVTIEPGVGVVTPARSLPRRFSFAGIAPNPVRGASLIRFALPERDRVSLTVYSVDGREVARLIDRVTEPGFHRLPWNGTNSAGHAVAPGHYLLRIVAGDKVKQQRFVLTR
jgi:hypothetical protein